MRKIIVSRGVIEHHKESKNKSYEARIFIKKVYIHISTRKTLFEASLDFDRYVIENNLTKVRLNFPLPEPYNDKPNTRWIRLTQGMYARVDDYNYDWLNKFEWHAHLSHKTHYAIAWRYENGKRFPVYMHRLIMGLTDDSGLLIDHKDRNGLENIFINLRSCNNFENMRNTSSAAGSSSIYKGVSWHKRDLVWVASIAINGHKTHIGYFKNEIEAAKAYDRVAFDNWGEFAYLNFPEDYNVAI